MKIWQHKYIELADLIHTNRSTDYTLALSTETGLPQFRLASKKKKPLSEREWNQAMSIYQSVYAERYPGEYNAMLTYAQYVRDLMSNGANWAWYDIEFRMDREFTLCRWDEVRQDLELRAFRPNTDNHKPFRANTSAYNRNTGTTAHNDEKPPPGYCFAYHGRNQRCTASKCTFKHTCPRCRALHPMFMRCNNHRTKPSSSDYNRDQSPKRDQPKSRNPREPRKTGGTPARL